MKDRDAIIEMFPTYDEAIRFFDDGMEDAVSIVHENEPEVYQTMNRIKRYTRAKERTFFLIYHKIFNHKLRYWFQATEDIKRYRRLKVLTAVAFGKQEPTKEILMGEDIDLAKNIPIREVIESYTKTSKGTQYPCPIHNEKSPSLQIYKDTNTWYCFGCGKGGDTIAFVMAVNDVEFKEAVRILNG